MNLLLMTVANLLRTMLLVIASNVRLGNFLLLVIDSVNHVLLAKNNIIQPA
jgi:hypothetical protein